MREASVPRLTAHAIPFLVLLLFLGACSPGEPIPGVEDAEPESPPITTPWLRVLVPVQPATDPIEGRRPFQLEVWRYAYASLLRLEAGATPTEPSDGPGFPGSLPVARPDLALAWQWNAEGASLRLSLDRTRTWSDGNRVTAGDVVRSYRYLEERDLLPVRPGPRGSGRGAGARIPADDRRRDPRGRDRILLSIDATGDSLVTLAFVPGVPSWLALEVATLPVLPKTKIDLASGVLKPEPGVPVPTPPRAAAFRIEPPGPFGEVRLAARQDLEARRAPRIEGVLLEVLPGDPGRIERVLRGEADIALDVSAEGVARRMRNERAVHIQAGAVGSVEMILFNVAREGIDPELREAVDLAIDRGRITGLFAVGKQTFAVGNGGFFLDPDPPPRPDLAAAAGLLGYPALPPPGAPSRRFLTLIYDRNNQTREQIATYLEEDLSRIGVALRPIPLEGPEVFRRYLEGDFEAALLGFQPPVSPDLSGLFASWGSWNGMGYASGVADSLVRELYRTEGEDLRRLAGLLERQVRADRPALFLVRRQRLDLVRARVHGFDGTAWLPLGDLGAIQLGP